MWSSGPKSTGGLKASASSKSPRGTLMHHYKADEKGAITKCNLIVSTTHNNEP